MSSDGDKACLSQGMYPCLQAKCEVNLEVTQLGSIQITGAHGQTQAQLQAGTEDTRHTLNRASVLLGNHICVCVCVAFLKALG